jgi:uncharacterized protein (TIGR03083 family)
MARHGEREAGRVEHDDRPSHLDRVAWLDELTAWFDALSVDDHRVPVPTCPGWDVGNVIAHIAYGAILFWLVPSARPSFTHLDFKAIELGLGDGDGVRVFPGAMRSLAAVLRSHDPSDPCASAVGPQEIGTVAHLAVTEVGMHRLDCEGALGRPRSMSTAQALDGLAFTTQTWWPALAGQNGPPDGSLALVGDGARHVGGAGPEVARITGSAPEVLAAAWGRPAAVAVEGNTEAATWWTTLTARTTAVAVRH